eukprot:3932891-Rhodomonas_salina.3
MHFGIERHLRADHVTKSARERAGHEICTSACRQMMMTDGCACSAETMLPQISAQQRAGTHLKADVQDSDLLVVARRLVGLALLLQQRVQHHARHPLLK